MMTFLSYCRLGEVRSCRLSSSPYVVVNFDRKMSPNLHGRVGLEEDPVTSLSCAGERSKLIKILWHIFKKERRPLIGSRTWILSGLLKGPNTSNSYYLPHAVPRTHRCEITHVKLFSWCMLQSVFCRQSGVTWVLRAQL